ncbi:MAG: GNAT family N-acetyltransferase [Bacteroidetes bacterium]|nr:GNAT family N-acetyltransferase [Bacteroidota bacterium]
MTDTSITLYTPFEKLSISETAEVTKFLHTHLQQYGDPAGDIQKAIAYAMKEIPSPGGFVVVKRENDDVIGAVVMNKTGMGGYIPEYILVYIAIHENQRGKGLGKQLMNECIQACDGDIALHVEPDNPAKFLYEKLGFENKYLEMRLKNKT